jgi:hypothetical protein
MYRPVVLAFSSVLVLCVGATPGVRPQGHKQAQRLAFLYRTVFGGGSSHYGHFSKALNRFGCVFFCFGVVSQTLQSHRPSQGRHSEDLSLRGGNDERDQAKLLVWILYHILVCLSDSVNGTCRRPEHQRLAWQCCEFVTKLVASSRSRYIFHSLQTFFLAKEADWKTLCTQLKSLIGAQEALKSASDFMAALRSSDKSWVVTDKGSKVRSVSSHRTFWFVTINRSAMSATKRGRSCIAEPARCLDTAASIVKSDIGSAVIARSARR